MHAIDAIILAVVAALLLLSLRATLRHYSGKGGGCCGCSGCSASGSCSQMGKDKIQSYQGSVPSGTPSRVLRIRGMRCNTCKHSVESALASLDGVLYADADVEKGTADVFLKKDVADDVLREAVEASGFEVRGIDR